MRVCLLGCRLCLSIGACFCFAGLIYTLFPFGCRVWYFDFVDAKLTTSPLVVLLLLLISCIKILQGGRDAQRDLSTMLTYLNPYPNPNPSPSLELNHSKIPYLRRDPASCHASCPRSQGRTRPFSLIRDRMLCYVLLQLVIVLRRPGRKVQGQMWRRRWRWRVKYWVSRL